MKNNIDKDIEKVNKLWYLLDDVYSTGLVEDEERNEYQQAISNVVSELEEKIEQIKVLQNNNRVLDISLGRELETHKDTNKELETYKKIAEKLAEDLSKHIWLNDKDAILKIYRERVEEDETHS